jgi:hypothetical protein
MISVFIVFAIVVIGLLVGTELSIAAFVHPTLGKLPDQIHQPAASALAAVLGRVMPVWYPLSFVLILVDVVVAWRESGTVPMWLVLSAVMWILATVFSLTSLVPINSRIASWDSSTLPADWKMERDLWDRRHRWRVLVLTLAFVFLIAGSIRG